MIQSHSSMNIFFVYVFTFPCFYMNIINCIISTVLADLRLCHTGAKNRQRKIVTKFVIRCVCHTEGLKSWQIMKKMTHKNLKIVKKLFPVSDI